jgi:hypothetical protein
VRLREAEAREGDELVVELVRLRLLHSLLERAATNRSRHASSAACERLRLIARRSPPPRRREAGEMDGDVEHLVLEDDDAERLAQRLLEQRMVAGAR